MQQLIDALEESEKVDYLLDTCFFVHVFEKNYVKDLVRLCREHRVGMSEFNLREFLNMHHVLHGTMNHHIRNFLKQKLLFRVPFPIHPGDKEAERRYVCDFDEAILKIVRDPSDAILLVQAIRMRASILTRDKHHLFTTLAEGYSHLYCLQILNEF